MSLLLTASARHFDTDGGDIEGTHQGYFSAIETGTWSPVVETSGRFSRPCFRFPLRDSFVEFAIPNTSTIYLQFAFWMQHVDNATDPCDWIWFRDLNDSNEKCAFQVRTRNGSLMFDKPTAEHRAWPLSQRTWHTFGCKVIISNTVGEMTAYLNGYEIGSFTSVDTIFEGANEYANRIRIGDRTGTGGGMSKWFMQDLVIMDGAGSKLNALLGDSSVITLMPDADTGQEDHTLSAGTDAFALLDDIPPDESSTYIVSDTVNDKTRVEMEDMPTGNWQPGAVVVRARTIKEGSGDNNVRTVLEHSSSENAGAVHTAPTANYEYSDPQIEEDVPGGTDWTETEVDAIECGVEIQA